MALTRGDLEAIRRVVREELARARGETLSDADEVHDPELEERARAAAALLMRARREAAERAARPIPDGPYVDAYDAGRLLDVSQATLAKWMKLGRLTRRTERGQLEFSRAEIDALLAARRQR